ncbi:protein maternal effect lethal 26-like [Argiope bruennichi]|uniref:protein maternal effect lethal 26-like n=1 Tax=Argiope bruennichi TaxID=94029 RepID=UPI002494F666|nr:protein maternal effect lethal 26-like [Argiope bruennichi]
MAENEEKLLKFIWKIENYSYCWSTSNSLQSPDFQMDVYEGSSWCLKLYPRGVPLCENYISIHLARLSSSSGPLRVSVDYEISLLRPDGTAEYVKETKDRCFRKGYTFGFDNLAVRDEVFWMKRSILLPQDILTVQCRIFPKDTQLKSSTTIIAKTHLELERYVFHWKSEKCFSEKLNEFKILKFLNGRHYLALKLYWRLARGREYLYIYFSNFHDLKMFHCKLCLLDSNESISQCILDEHIDSGQSDFRLIAADEIREKKSIFLPNDKLNLHCDFTCYFGIQCNQIETVAFDNTIFSVIKDKETSSEVETPSANNRPCSCTNIYASFKKDFQNFYQEEMLCDFTLKVGNENIQAHKAVLAARSPVFKAMLTSNMRENEKNLVEISDLDADTVRCMLTFLYSDTTGDLDWEAARKLYFAADKYEIRKLKRICSDILKRNLSVSSVGATLSLANLHADDNLKDLTLNFIFKHDAEVICSMEWKEFMADEAHLAAEAMRYIFLKKQKIKENSN